jgi:hypothetical protein
MVRVPARVVMWLLISVPHLVMHSIRQGLPVIISFIARDLSLTTNQTAFLLGAFYPGCAQARGRGVTLQYLLLPIHAKL